MHALFHSAKNKAPNFYLASIFNSYVIRIYVRNALVEINPYLNRVKNMEAQYQVLSYKT